MKGSGTLAIQGEGASSNPVRNRKLRKKKQVSGRSMFEENLDFLKSLTLKKVVLMYAQKCKTMFFQTKIYSKTFYYFYNDPFFHKALQHRTQPDVKVIS